jgi:predicted transcriptional regulator YheO
MIGYQTRTEDGLVMRSSTVFFTAPSGKPVACLCINSDIGNLIAAQEALATLTAINPAAGEPVDAASESFPVSVETLTEKILRDAVASAGVPVALMKKEHKLRVVAELDRLGFFALREAAELAARRLEVSRYTIYNYLNELESAAG